MLRRIWAACTAHPTKFPRPIWRALHEGGSPDIQRAHRPFQSVVRFWRFRVSSETLLIRMPFVRRLCVAFLLSFALRQTDCRRAKAAAGDDAGASTALVGSSAPADCAAQLSFLPDFARQSLCDATFSIFRANCARTLVDAHKVRPCPFCALPSAFGAP
eukprot:scaffold7916_cov286-Pinguiococcus_pyrenoidosus.AAC.3